MKDDPLTHRRRLYKEVRSAISEEIPLAEAPPEQAAADLRGPRALQARDRSSVSWATCARF
jgi:hypothetical protein